MFLKLLYPTSSFYLWETEELRLSQSPHDIWKGQELSSVCFSIQVSVYTTSSSPLLLFKATMMPSWVLCTHMFYINSLYMFCCCCCCSTVSSSLWSHGLQHTRLPGPSPSPGACSNSCPLSQRCHPTILSSVIPFSCPQSFPASGSFPISWLFASSDQSYWSLSFSISPSNEHSGLISFRIDRFDLLEVKQTLKSFLQHHNSKSSILLCSAFFMVQLSLLYMPTKKNHSFDYTRPLSLK